MEDQTETGRLFVISSAEPARTTVGRALAETLTKAVFIDGEVVGDVVVSGRAEVGDEPSSEAVEQLLFRYAGGLVLADTDRAAGFDAVIAEEIPSLFFEDYLEIAAPETLHLVLLGPTGDAGATDGSDAVGLRLDPAERDVPETVLEIIKRQHEAVVETPEG